MTRQNPLAPLKYPVYFVCKDVGRWQLLMNDTMPPPVEQWDKQLINGNDVWCVQTYLQLKRRGLEVYLVPNYVPGRICVTTYDHLDIKDFSFNSYVVTCRGDRGRPEICEQRVVQNHLNVIDESDSLLPLWPQPNLKPRDSSRGTTIETLVYKGHEAYLAQPFRSSEFSARLAALGVSLSISPTNYETLSADWTDYTQADLVIAVRNCTEYDLSIKPPSKLINAWLAGCPALLGPEPAYQYLRKSELDYIEVRSPEEVIRAVQRLQDNPALYSAIVENGFRRAQAFTSEAIALLWRNLLAVPIAADYEQWLSNPPLQKWVGRPLQFAWRAYQHKRQRQYYFTHILRGPRLFPEGETQ